MNDPHQQPQYNDAQEEDDRQPPHKGSKWRKKAGTDEAYDPIPPPDKAPNLTDYIEQKQDADDEDEEPTLEYELDLAMHDDDITSNAPNLSEND